MTLPNTPTSRLQQYTVTTQAHELLSARTLDLTHTQPSRLESQLESRLESQLERLESQLESRLESTLAAKILIFLDQEQSGKAALAKKLGHTTVSGELHKQVKRLLELDLINMTLPDKPTSRLQQYHVTKQAHKLLQSLDKETS